MPRAERETCVTEAETLNSIIRDCKLRGSLGWLKWVEATASAAGCAF
jgi:hypothetical protein